MLRRGGIRWALALVLIMALASPVFAGEPGQAAGGGLSRLWAETKSWIAAALPWAVEASTPDRGPYIDPNGETGESDRGSYIDPDGATNESDRGSHIDPDG